MKKKFKKSPNVYLALFLSLVAVGLGGLAAMREDSVSTLDESEEFTRIRIEWSAEQTEEPLTNEVNIRVSGIEDERVYSTTEKIEENKPYSGNFALPMGTDIIKDYSGGEMVFSETMGDWRVHNGVDFSGSAGNEVKAVADGTVTKVYDDSFWGTVVEIDHGNGMTARYCGLGANVIGEGEKVEKHGRIGTLGHIPVEISEEDHLHLEILIDGANVDPLKALNKVGN